MDWAKVKEDARHMPHLSGKPHTRWEVGDDGNKVQVIKPDIFVDPTTPHTVTRVIPVPVWETYISRQNGARQVTNRRVVRHRTEDGNWAYHYRIRPLTIHLDAFDLAHALRLVNNPYEMVNGQLNIGVYEEVLNKLWQDVNMDSRPWRQSAKKEESKIGFYQVPLERGDRGLVVDYREGQ